MFVLLCARCLKPCLHGVRLQPLAKPSSRRKEAQGENALCLRAEVSVSDKCRGRLERRVRYDRNMFFAVPRKAILYIELTLKTTFRNTRGQVLRNGCCCSCAASDCLRYGERVIFLLLWLSPSWQQLSLPAFLEQQELFLPLEQPSCRSS